MNSQPPEPRPDGTSTRAFPGLHVALIMDGNGRWAVARGLPRCAGHVAGAEAVRRVVAAAPAQGIGVLTLFAFSAANWKRPALEVAELLWVFRSFFLEEKEAWAGSGTRASVIGRRDRLSEGLAAAIESAEAATRRGTRLHLRIAIDYSAREAVLAAADRVRTPEDVTPGGFARLLAEAVHAEHPVPEVDLLVRTGGEVRLSDCLLWEGSFTELAFSPRMWPEFGEADLAEAVAAFRARDRRFGVLPGPAPHVAPSGAGA